MSEATAKTATSAQSEIQKLIEDQVAAIRVKDVEAATAFAAPDVRAFDLIDPLVYQGKEEVQKRLTQWFESFEGDTLGFDVTDLQISAGEDIAFCSSLNKVNGTTVDGNKLEMFWRATICFEKTDGQWVATHQHSSVPFNMETGKASMDLKP